MTPTFTQPSSVVRQGELQAALEAERPVHPMTVPLREWVQETLWNAAYSRPRSRQTAVGFSEYAQPCARRLAYGAYGVPKVATPDPWRADVGTAVHAHLAEVMRNLNAGSGRYLIETPVIYKGIPGTCDLYDRRRRMVLDWKTTTSHSRKMRSKGAPTKQEVLQVAGYAVALEATGETVEYIALVILPVDLELSDIRVWVGQLTNELRAEVEATIRAALLGQGARAHQAHPDHVVRMVPMAQPQEPRPLRPRVRASMARPRLLDLFCGGGGASMGYHLAGFDVVGVDIEEQPRYPFPFHLGDALEWPLDGFDLIHASPPCQGYTALLRGRETNHPRLIGDVRARLRSAGGPYIIENVPHAKREMRNPLNLCGESFGLSVIRHRLFESSLPLRGPRHSVHRGRARGWRQGEFHEGPYLQIYGDGGSRGSTDDWRDAMRIPWMDKRELREAIPPAYTLHLGAQALALITTTTKEIHHA